ncbi:MAG: FmdE family protein [Anaerolineales bacterium]|jgi:formylmethanofuran dehydrogenase subunit E
MKGLGELLQASSARHSHLCPRQVLGVRIGLAGPASLGLEAPRTDKRLLVILETDGCFADGIEVATGCTIGHRTLRLEDYGKIAATFVDVRTGNALRLAPRLDVRERAYDFVPDEKRHYFAQLEAYQIMPDADLLTIQSVELSPPAAELISRAGVRVNCSICGEEIINQREVTRNGLKLCQACEGMAYFRLPISVPDHYLEIENTGEKLSLIR